MKNKCSFCKEYKTLKNDSDKCQKDSRYSTNFKISLRTELYFDKRFMWSDTFRGHKLNYCPVCGKKLKERGKNG